MPPAQPTLIERVVNIFGDCTTVPEEQFEYFAFQPLLQPFDEIVWSDSESEESEFEGEEEDERGSAHPPPKAEKLKADLRAAGKGHLAGKTAYTPSEAVEVARVAGFAPDKEEERVAPACRNYDDLKRWMETIAHSEDTANYLLKFFRHLDKHHTGTLRTEQLKHALTNLGGENALSPEECDMFFAQFGLRGDVDYVQLVDRLLRRELV